MQQRGSLKVKFFTRGIYRSMAPRPLEEDINEFIEKNGARVVFVTQSESSVDSEDGSNFTAGIWYT